MQKQHIISIIFLCWLVLISACQNTANTPAPTAAFTLTSELSSSAIPLVSPTLAPTPYEPLFDLYKTIPPESMFIKGTLPTMPGDYLLYEAESDLPHEKNDIRYISLNGENTGILMTDPGTIRPQIKWTGADALGFVFYKRQYSQQNVFVGSSTVSLWRTDVFGNPLRDANQLNVKVGENDECSDPVVSPRGNWMIIDCHSLSRRYVILVNIRAETIRKFDIQCQSFLSSPDLYVNTLIWSDDEMNFLYDCGVGEYEFVSLSANTQVHKYINWSVKNGGSGHIDPFTSRYKGEIHYVNRRLSVSPDWKSIALDMGERPKNSDGDITGFQIFIADANYALSNPDCALNEPICNRGVIYDLPLGEPYHQTEYQGGLAFELEWSHSGDRLVWATYKSMGWIDLSTHTNHIFENKTPGLLLGLSPDDKWMVFSGTDENSGKFGLFVMSIENNTLTRFLAEPQNFAKIVKFYGWLTIP